MLTLLYASAAAQPPQTPAALYDATQVWRIHLRFTKAQWEAMEPKGGDQGFGFGGPPPGGGGFGAGSLLAPIFLKAGDTNFDSALSRAEFLAVGERWFTTWDSGKKGKVTLDQLQTGLNTTLKPPPMNLQAPEGKRNGVAGMMGIEFNYVHAQLDFAGQTFPDVAVRYKGNGTFITSRGALKKPLKVDLNKYTKTNTLAGITTLNLHNSVADASWMNDTLAHRFFRDAGVPAPRTSYAKVFLTVPELHENRYVGLYEVVEEVGNHFVKEHFGTDAGVLFKPSTPELFAYRGDDWKRYNQTYDPKGKPSDAQKRRLIGLCKLVSTASNAEFTQKIGEFIDLPAFASYMAALVCVTDLDGILGPGQNLYLYLHPKTQKFHFIPWDYDQSWGQFGMRGTQEQREQLSLKKPWQGENRFLERVFSVPAFQSAYRAKLQSLSTTLLIPARLSAQVDALTPQLRPAVAEESKDVLARFDTLAAGKSLTPEGPFAFSPLKPIKAFVPIRAKSIREQLAGKSAGLTLSEFSFGPPGGNFGLGNLFAPEMLAALDGNKDKSVSRAEVQAGFAAWFVRWDTGKKGSLSEESLRVGLDKTFSFPSPPTGFGPPPSERP